MVKFGAPEQVTLVDKMGKTIGSMERKSMGPDDRCLAATIWLSNHKGDILIAKRSGRVLSYPNLWSAAAEGIATFGDTAEETAVREVGEELGIEGIQLEKLSDVILHDAGRGKRYKVCFRGIVDVPIESLKLQVEEVAEVKVVTPDALVEDWQSYPEKYVPHFGQYLVTFGLIEKV